MFRDARYIRTMRFACDTTHLHIRCDLRRWGNFQLALIFQLPRAHIALTPPLTRGLRGTLTLRREGSEIQTGAFAADEVVEISIPLAQLTADHALRFQLKVICDGIERECYPEAAPVEITPPTSDHALASWQV